MARSKNPTASIPTALVEDFRKILAFASSAGDTITNRDALEVIRSICHARLGTDERAAAVGRHVHRVSEILGVGRG